MRKILMAAVCAVMLVGCGEGFRFEVEMPTRYPDATFYLSPENNPTTYYMKAKSDSEGVVRFEGRMRQPVAACVSDGYVAVSHTFFVEEGSVKFGYLSETDKTIVAMGTESNDAYNQYLVDMKALEVKYATCDSTCVNVVDIEAEMNRDFEALGAAVQAANYDNILGVYLFVKEGLWLTAPERVDSIVACFSPEMREHPYMREVLQKAK